jgi:phage shock protein B
MSAAVTTVIIMALAMSPALIAVTGAMFLSYRKQVMKMRMDAAPERQHLQALADTAQRMEQRMAYLEDVLDHEAPGWRSRSENV